MIENIYRVQLQNGVRVLVEPVPTVRSVAIGLWIAAGARYEQPNQRGIAHFIEHMIFKGTPKRNARQIAEEIEGRGGVLNAFTDKEITCYYARVLSEHTPIALDILTDMFLNSLYDPEELEREKGVILEEMKLYEDNPNDLIHDLFSETHWVGHPLGRRVIGTKETVSAFTRDMLLEFISTHYTPDRVVVAAAGDVQPEEFISAVEQILGRWQGGEGKKEQEKGNEQKGEESKGQLKEASNPFPKESRSSLFPREVEQVHFCLGGDAPHERDERKYALAVLNSILGGNMFSRLWQEIREKRGLAYDIGSYPALFSDKGLFVVYGGTASEAFEQVQELVHQEFQKLRQEPIPPAELENAKNQLKGSLLLNLEAMQARMSRLGRMELVYGYLLPIEEVIRKVEAVTEEDIHLLAEAILQPDHLTLAAIVPQQGTN